MVSNDRKTVCQVSVATLGLVDILLSGNYHSIPPSRQFTGFPTTTWSSALVSLALPWRSLTCVGQRCGLQRRKRPFGVKGDLVDHLPELKIPEPTV